jgi:DHA2 family multidrug resistance protein
MTTQSKFIILTAVLASLLEIIDTSIVNVAIPSMMGNLGATLEDISWVVTGYIIANAIVLPLSAWLGSRIGRRKYFVGCILLFTATSVACGLAPNLLTLTIFRIFQGLAGGALLPTSQTLIYEQFPKEKAGIGSAIFGMSVMVGPTVGPTLGGYLTDQFNWRMIFNINLPLGILAAIMAYANIKEPEHHAKPADGQPKSKIDSIGLALLTVGIGTLQYVLERGEADDWFDSRVIMTCAILAAIAIPTFIWWELKVENPIVNVRLFTDPIVRSGTMLMTALGFFLYGLIFITPVFVGRILHYDATTTGLLFVPGALLTVACMPFVGRAMSKIDTRFLILFGFFMVEVCAFMMSQFSSQTDDRQIFWAMLARGMGMAFLFVPINTIVLGQFKGPNLGQVAGLMNLLRQIGGSVGIAVIGTLLQSNSQQNYIDIVGRVSPLNPMTQLTTQQTVVGMSGKMNEMIGMAPPSQAALAALSNRVQTQVFIMSFTQMMWIFIIVVAFTVIPLFMLKPPKGPVEIVDAH